MAAEIIRITFKNGAYIDMQSRNAYDCAGQQATKLSEKPLEVLRCIAEHTITASDGTLTSDISTAEIFKLCWTKDVDLQNVTQQIRNIRKCISKIYPEEDSKNILRQKNKKTFLCHSDIVRKSTLLIDVTLEELYARVTDDFRFVTAGDDSIFPQDETGTEQLTKRVLLFTGDCFLGMEHKTAVPDKLLADLFCSNTADDRVSECIFSKCLSPEERDQEELDYKRMCAVWDELAGSDKRAESDKLVEFDKLVGFIGKNLINSSRTTSYANDYNKIPYSMAEIKLSEYPQVLIDARYQNILNRLAPYVAEKCGEKLRSLECDTDLIHAAQNGDKKETDGGKKVVYAYIAALVLLFFDRAIPAHSSKFSQKKKRYQKALDRCIQKMLPSETPPSKQVAEKLKEILSGKSEKEIEEILTDLFGSLDDEYVKAIRDHLNRKNISIENTDQLIDPPPKLTL